MTRASSPVRSGTSGKRADGPAVSSRVEQGERSKEAILEAAVKLFAERGYHGVSLDEITLRAGAKRSLILYHFKNKLELWRSAVEMASERFDAAVRSRLDQNDGSQDATRHGTASWLDAFLAEPDFARMLVLEGGRPGERLDWLIQHFHHAEIPLAARPGLHRQMTETVLRDALMAIYLSMSALGPLMEASLAKATGKPDCGVFPLSPQRRAELIDLIVNITNMFTAGSDRDPPAGV